MTTHSMTNKEQALKKARVSYYKGIDEAWKVYHYESIKTEETRRRAIDKVTEALDKARAKIDKEYD